MLELFEFGDLVFPEVVVEILIVNLRALTIFFAISFNPINLLVQLLNSHFVFQENLTPIQAFVFCSQKKVLIVDAIKHN